MFYIYIIYSESADKYYIGYTNDPDRRLVEHNTVIKNSYTFKFRPWILKSVFMVSESRGEARKIENYIKKMKSRSFIENQIVRLKISYQLLKWLEQSRELGINPWVVSSSLTWGARNEMKIPNIGKGDTESLA